MGRYVGASRLRRVVGVAAVSALLATACGGGSNESALDPEVDSGEATAETAASPTTAAATTDETEETGDSVPAVEPTSFELDPLVDDDLGASLWASMIDAHGMTNDLAGEINRVAEFPAIPTPSDGAFIVELGTESESSLRNRPEDTATVRQTVRVFFLVSGSTDDALTFYETSLAPLGWSREGIEQGATVNDVPFTEVSLVSTDEAREGTLQLTILDLRNEEYGAPTGVQIRLVDRTNPRNELLARMGQWGEELVPDGALLVEAGGGSSFSNILPESQMSVSAEYNHSLTKEEIVAHVEQVAAAKGVETEPTDLGVTILAGPASKIDVKIYDQYFEMVSFNNVIVMELANVDLTEGAVADTPDSAANVGSLQLAEASDPVPDSATPDQIEAVVNDIHGPIDDLASAMARLGRFPLVPTPDGAEVYNFQFQIGQIVNAEELLAVTNFITLEVPEASVDDVAVFYDTQLSAAGWTRTGTEEKDSTDEGEKYLTQTYSIGELEAGIREPLSIAINNEVAGMTRVTITYNEWVDSSDINVDRWLGWQGDTPLPDGGRLSRLGVRSTPGEMALFYGNVYDEVDRDTIRADVEALVPGSDYSIVAAESNEFQLGLSHPDFDSGSFSFVSAPTRQLELEMVRSLE